ncbi:MAG TPA: tyrosine-type recombinase/integrase, partial [Bacillus sp. (in: firmicutes)]|nr:tyrosine-type recombinase/integrase [Bacillus sp. (in: firmicutes)]
KLRHTFCQKLVDNNIDIDIVSRLAGHRDLNVTKRYVKSKMNRHKLEEVLNNVFINDTLG